MSKRKFAKPSEGYFEAKREMQAHLDLRLAALRSKVTQFRKEGNYTGLSMTLFEMEIVENERRFVRNFMLWDTRRGK